MVEGIRSVEGGREWGRKGGEGRRGGGERGWFYPVQKFTNN